MCIRDRTKVIKESLKSYRYLDEALELSKECGLAIDEAEIIRTNSTGLVIYNPKNVAERIRAMKNKSISRQDKILARMKYEKEQAVNT